MFSYRTLLVICIKLNSLGVLYRLYIYTYMNNLKHHILKIVVIRKLRKHKEYRLKLWLSCL